jgi:CHAT domain-containing protein
MTDHRRRLAVLARTGLFALLLGLTGSATAETPAPSEISAQIELQFHDRWDAYWVRVRWTPVAEKGFNYIVQASLEDAPNKILEHGYVRNGAKWTFPGGERGVTYVIRVQACAEANRRDCSQWTYGRVPIPKTTEEMARTAVNPPAPVKSPWSQEFEASGKEWLGPYFQNDPDALGRVWRRPGEITGCRQLEDVARAPRDAIEALGRMIAAFDAQTDESRKRPQWVAPAEIAKAEVLSFNGREQEATAFLMDRLPRRISPLVPGNESLDANHDGERDRWAKLTLALMRIQSTLHNPDAENLARRLIDANTKKAWVNYAQRTATNNNLTFIAKAAADRDWTIARARAEILAEHYLEVGRLQDASLLLQAEAQQRKLNPDPAVSNSKGGHLSALLARTALAEASPAEAERLLRNYAKECNGCSDVLFPLAQLLVRGGRPGETAGMIVRLKVDVAEKIEGKIQCWGGFASGTETGPDANRAARPFPYDTVVALGQTLARGTELGVLLIDAGRVEDAIRVLDPVLALQRRLFGITHPTSLATLAARARAEAAVRRSEQAAALWSEWVDASSGFLSDRLWSISATDRRAFLRGDRVNVSSFLGALVGSKDDASAAGQALMISLGRKGLLARIAADSGALARATKEPRARPLVEALVKGRAELAEATLMGTEGREDGISVRRKRLDAAEIALAGALRSARPPWTVPTVEQALASMAEGEALVDFQVFQAPRSSPPQSVRPEQMVAVVATRRDGVRMFRWPDLTPVQAAIARYRQALFAAASDRDLRRRALDRASDDLYTLVWQPLAGALQSVHRIYLIPDGPLNSVPLPALKTPGGSYLIEQFEIAQLTAPRELLFQDGSNDATAATARALVVGAPEFGKGAAAAAPESNPRGNRGASLRNVFFTPLPGTLDESRQVASILKAKFPVTLLNGAEARKAAITSVKSPSILHLATHGFYLDAPESGGDSADPVDALARSGLALANANLATQDQRMPKKGDDGILTALEAISMDLTGTWLVTLSACETGIGLVEAGEGVHGLARAFREAGAQTVIATLWPISDSATSAFMQDFYRRLAGGERPQTALRAVQIQFLRGQIWRDPLYWAPFVLIGR